MAKYDLSSRSAKSHRKQIRDALGFRPATRADEERLAGWLADEVCPIELVEDWLRWAVLVRCRSDRIDLQGRIEPIVAAARARSDRLFCTQTSAPRPGILFRLADAAVGRPAGTVHAVLCPVVSEKTLRDLVAEAKANEKAFKAKVRTTLRSSYSSYYRQMLPPLLNTLGLKCNSTTYRPVMDALAPLAKYADVDGKTRFYDVGDAVPTS
ncbi:hypothetical protein ACWD3J_49520 [Streptomyces sp. NPDC002755]|uniref:hypothetical protein n=1 Tax=Streptomyces sp. NPDC002884 TaxID=3154544 RepID=UPI00332786EE